MAPEVQVDLNAISQEIDKLSPEQIKEQLLQIRTRAKVQQKKHQNPEKQKAYQMKARERAKLLKAKALELGFYDEVNTAAEAAAEAKLAAEAAESETDEE